MSSKRLKTHPFSFEGFSTYLPQWEAHPLSSNHLTLPFFSTEDEEARAGGAAGRLAYRIGGMPRFWWLYFSISHCSRASTAPNGPRRHSVRGTRAVVSHCLCTGVFLHCLLFFDNPIHGCRMSIGVQWQHICLSHGFGRSRLPLQRAPLPICRMFCWNLTLVCVGTHTPSPPTFFSPRPPTWLRSWPLVAAMRQLPRPPPRLPLSPPPRLQSLPPQLRLQ